MSPSLPRSLGPAVAKGLRQVLLTRTLGATVTRRPSSADPAEHIPAAHGGSAAARRLLTPPRHAGALHWILHQQGWCNYVEGQLVENECTCVSEDQPDKPECPASRAGD